LNSNIAFLSYALIPDVGSFIFLKVVNLITAVSNLLPNILADNGFFSVTNLEPIATLLLFFTRPFVNKFSKKDEIQTNAYSIIGKRGIVIKEIDPISGQGQIKVGTEVWSAKSLEDKKIEKGSEVEITQIDGVKAVVK